MFKETSHNRVTGKKYEIRYEDLEDDISSSTLDAAEADAKVGEVVDYTIIEYTPDGPETVQSDRLALSPTGNLRDADDVRDDGVALNFGTPTL